MSNVVPTESGGLAHLDIRVYGIKWIEMEPVISRTKFFDSDFQIFEIKFGD